MRLGDSKPVCPCGHSPTTEGAAEAVIRQKPFCSCSLQDTHPPTRLCNCGLNALPSPEKGVAEAVLRHKWAKEIAAALEGKQIQIWTSAGSWYDYGSSSSSQNIAACLLNAGDLKVKFRIKPESKPDTKYCINLGFIKSKFKHYSPRVLSCWQGAYPDSATDAANMIATFDGETGELKSVEIVK